MKINVRRNDGSIETLTLVPPIEIYEGNLQSHIHCGDGTDYYFYAAGAERHIEGDYDGWGRAVSIEVPDGQEQVGFNLAGEEIQKFEDAREFPTPPNPRP